MNSFPQTIQSIYQALEQGKLVKVLVLLNADIVVHQASSLPYGGTFYGREGFITSLSGILATWEIYRKAPKIFLTDETNIAVLGEVQLKGKLADDLVLMPFVDHWTFHDEKVSQIRMFDWDTALLRKHLNLYEL
ncbi:nuclear transport factor 2 family protein [Spirosoma pollinicola]|uniref:SnoaL-like domain-containing protein n=1 Tax=Spirosoma pollinicola TaxID=2057025 RepID=A0A2K8Z8X2_9BACT|nr:nuclear transport factor 2 family protein [Spirosoma pollinicola]AUD06321.1 hypothetical protein CWM47_33455 [Spirosoma pollinicola]